MKNKYYTPELEDLCVNFECDVFLQIFDNNVWVEKWVSVVIIQVYPEFIMLDSRGVEHKFPFSNGKFKTLKIRVKYLDKEDIESLEFESNTSNSVYFKKDGYRLVHWIEASKERTLIIFKVFSDGDEEVIFKGNIKNKSELKKLLKQLNVK